MSDDGADVERPGIRVGTTSEHIDIRVLGRAHPGFDDYWDGNWLVSTIDIRAGAFSGTYTASLRVDEFDTFLTELRHLDAWTPGVARFAPTEPWLNLKVEVDQRGRLDITGDAADGLGMCNRLEFELPQQDQSLLAPLIREVELVLHQYPVVGSRDE